MHFRNALRVARGLRVSGSKAMAKGASWLRPLMFWLTPITRSPAQGSACKDLERNGQTRAITFEAAYTPIPKRAGSRSLTFSPCFLRADSLNLYIECMENGSWLAYQCS